MCNHPNREAAMVRIQGTPVPGVTTKVGYCDPCLLPLVQALNDGGITTIASCCGHGHRPGWIALTDDRWLVVATEEQRHVIDAAFPVDINGRVWDQTEDGLAGDETDLIDAVEVRIRSLLLGDLDDDGPHRVAAAAVDECLKYLTPKENLRRAFGQAFDSGVRVERSGQTGLLADQPDEPVTVTDVFVARLQDAEDQSDTTASEEDQR